MFGSKYFLNVTLLVASMAGVRSESDKDGKHCGKPCRRPCYPADPPSLHCSVPDGCFSTSECGTTTLVNLDFYLEYPLLAGLSANWAYYSPNANDGSLSFGKCGGVLLSNPFTKWALPSAQPELDNWKYFVYGTTAVSVPTVGKAVFEFIAGAEIANTKMTPYPEAVLQGAWGNDMRLATAMYGVTDFVQYNLFAFALTNDRIYVIYQRYPFARSTPPFGNYAAYMYAIPVAKRKACQIHTMAVNLHARKNHVSWDLEGKEVFRVKHVGYHIPQPIGPIYDYGGTEEDSFPSAVNDFFGTFTFLDAYPAPTEIFGCKEPCQYPPVREAIVNNALLSPNPQYNPVLGPSTLASYWDPVGTTEENHIFGQGVTSKIKRLRAIIMEC